MRARSIVAVHVLLFRSGKVLLLRRNRTGYEDGNYSVVAGHVEADEDVVSAAVRESAEEVGVTLARDRLSVVGVMQRRVDDGRIDFFLRADEWSGEPFNREPEKCDLLRWSSPFSLPANTIGYVRRALQEANRAPWFASLGWADHDEESSGRDNAQW